jgi:hypothetical protein
VKDAAASCQRACLFAMALASISQAHAKHQAEGVALLQRLGKDSIAPWQEVATLSLAKPLANTGRIEEARKRIGELTFHSKTCNLIWAMVLAVTIHGRCGDSGAIPLVPEGRPLVQARVVKVFAVEGAGPGLATQSRP